MRAWIGSRIDDGTTAVFAIDRAPRPSMEEVGSVLGELRRLSDSPGDPAQEAAVLARKEDLLDRIEASERVGEVLPLHPTSGRRFDWGEDSPVGFELARAVLTDAVGDPPPHHLCGIQTQFGQIVGLEWRGRADDVPPEADRGCLLKG